MSPNRLELATLKPGLPRSLVVAEPERPGEGVAVAMLLHDPSGVSPHWTLAEAAGRELPERRLRARDFGARLPELGMDPELVLAVVAIEGNVLTAWALPGAAVLVHQSGTMGELLLRGFAAVPSSPALGLSFDQPGWRSGSMDVAPGMSFCLVPRATLDRAGYRAFSSQLAAPPSAALAGTMQLAAGSPIVAGRWIGEPAAAGIRAQAPGMATGGERGMRAAFPSAGPASAPAPAYSAHTSPAPAYPTHAAPAIPPPAAEESRELVGAGAWDGAATRIDPASGHAWAAEAPLLGLGTPAVESAAQPIEPMAERPDAGGGSELLLARRRSSSLERGLLSRLFDGLAAKKPEAMTWMAEAMPWQRSRSWAVVGLSLVVTLALLITVGRFLIGPRPEGVPVEVEVGQFPERGRESGDKSRREAPPPPSFTGASWSHAFTGGISSSPLLAADLVIFGGKDGKLHALGLQDGAERWQLDAKSGIGSSPATAGGLVVVGTYAGDLIGAEPATGHEVWRTRLGGKIVSSPAVTDQGLVVVGAHDKQVYGVSGADGTILWQTKTGGIVWASPVVAGEHVLVGSYDKQLYCLDAATGQVVWKGTTGGTISGNAAVLEDRVVVGSGDGAVRAFDLVSGKQLWVQKVGSAVAGGAVAAGDVVLVGTDSGNLIALAAADGSRRYQVKTGGPIKCRPALAGDHLWFTSYDGLLRVADAATGAEQWRFQAQGQLYSSPAVLGQTAFFGSLSGPFYAATWSAAEPGPAVE
ncbi:MAG TPA: PQQ-binding-like beta-propeller repeat protein [Candidatus Udaeobacter sp.]|nr:PQQ-binding-like beta-propeller repeat protein [Candidatus Udaeobacter sp.]